MPLPRHLIQQAISPPANALDPEVGKLALMGPEQRQDEMDPSKVPTIEQRQAMAQALMQQHIMLKQRSQAHQDEVAAQNRQTVKFYNL